MKLSTAMVFLAALAAFGAPARADQSKDLIELCEQYLALPKGGEVTSGFIVLKSSCAGFINSHFKMSKPEDGFCRPKNYNMDDLATIYMSWVKKHPDRIGEPTKVTMSEALAEVYPCPK
jgi:Rap1a immunity proteins